MDDDLDAGLFSISISDSEDAAAEPSEQSKIETEQSGGRTGQSETAFQSVRSSYYVKLENGEIWKSIKLPLSHKVGKPELQEILHAAEELYFYRRYEEAVKFIKSVLDEENAKVLGKDVIEVLQHYEARSLKKMGNPQ